MKSLLTAALLAFTCTTHAQEYGYGDGSILMETAEIQSNPNGYRTYAFISTTRPIAEVEAIIPFAYGYDETQPIISMAKLEWVIIPNEEITNSGYMIDGIEFYVGPTIEEDANSWQGYKFRVNSSTEEGELSWCGYGVPVLYIFISYYSTDGNIYSDFIQTTAQLQRYK
ncbi:MAG: hypothetical protein NC206_10565 [Bacteroides sp.]|nr:hypothetical protein [Roseburia sp.]MCM1347510.1 hypothetical protein [Bacteroides sp.]MCM1422011.1 hypothetical protein [Bacteroides sp.]